MSEPSSPDRKSGRSKGDHSRLQVWFVGIIAFAVILFLLVQASFLLISLSIAIMLFSLTSDAISYIQNLRFGRARVSVWIASTLAVLMIATFLIAISAIILAQANALALSIVQYIDPAQRAVADMFAWMGEDVQQAVLAWLKGIQLAPWLSALAGQAGNIASGAVLVILFVGFLFLERMWFTVKLESLFGDPDRAAHVQRIISSIMRSQNIYLVVKTIISALTGGLVFVLMKILGLNLAMPMAVVTFVLNFIPNVGSILATLLVSMVGFVQTGDELTGLALLGIVGAMQFVIGQVLDPLFLGRTLRMSPFAILVSLAFWALVWGLPGMFLAVPIMVTVMIICSHVPGLRPVAVILSREGLPDIALAEAEGGKSERAPEGDET